MEKTKAMFLYGASGHGKVIKEILEVQGIPVDGFIDDNPEIRELCGLPVVHSVEDVRNIIVSIGDNAIRKKVVERLSCDFNTAIHPSAVISPSVQVGEGTVVMAGALINAESKIGKHCIINTGVSVDHECIIEDYVHVSPHATLCGDVFVGEGTWVGAGTTVIQGVKIGRWCVIGAGSVVTKDIPDGYLAVGNRCKLVKQINFDKL
jgi:sugar O-acyltransferase (sialic acid O-acetyltransferase NeuD family)